MLNPQCDVIRYTTMTLCFNYFWRHRRMFSYGSVFELLICYYVMAFSICYWANYTQGKTKLSGKSENAVAYDRVLKFSHDVDLRHVESSV